MAVRYPTYAEGEWAQVGGAGMRAFRMECGDCGLVHELRFRVTEDGRIEMQAFRLNRVSGQRRRHLRAVKPLDKPRKKEGE